MNKCKPLPLGIVPHQIRGFVYNFNQVLFAAPAFPRCTAGAYTRQLVMTT